MRRSTSINEIVVGFRGISGRREKQEEEWEEEEGFDL